MIKRLIPPLTLVFIGLCVLSACAWAQATDVPINEVSLAVTSFKLGAWVAGSLALIQLAVKLVKVSAGFSSVMKKYGKLVIMILSAVGAVLAMVVGGVSWMDAGVMFLVNNMASFVHDLMTEVGMLKTKE